ncbi:uncharacterized protein IL334_004039 [Kwoniella shivajii]|uniref:RAN protein binding protein n=1 Tax=Kwoniella shivajii TaxID=564305 RepID=A0ABZ1CZ78_9TREE|nr:hypothetical protein IL334_004039 [Kwoniella shivajii]
MSTAVPQTNGHADTSIPSTTPASGSAQTSKIQPNDVGWQFVPQYYNFVNKQPHRLHCFYNKRSTFIHGEEGEESQVALGQQEIHDRIVAIGYNECKVYIHSIDSQSSANGGIIILVIGEMSNNHQSWRKFTQTFFLAEQPNGYFVLNDIFRYLKEDVDEDEIAEEEPDTPAPVAESTPAPEVAPVEEEIETKEVERVTQEPASAPEPEPEPVSAPAEIKEDAVPEEAAVAAVPDKDVAPSESAPSVEEPTTSAPPPAEETPAPSPASAAAKPAASPTPAPAAPSPAPAAAPPAAPAQPAAPPKPKTWASLAASGGKAWSSAVVSNQTAVSTPAAVPASAAKKEETPAATAAPAASGSADGKSQTFNNTSRVNTAHCFVKLPNWSPDNNHSAGEAMTENDLKNVAARFGEVKKIEIVKDKACAFVEFVKVESARKAIAASLPVAQGGEDGVKFEGGKLNFETRKEKDERRTKAGGQGQGQGQGRPGQQQSGGGRPRVGSQQANGERNQQGGNRGARGPRGRGGQGNQGDRAPQSGAK